MRALKFITGHVIYNITAYTYKFQLKTTKDTRLDTILANQKQLRDDLKEINENVKENGRLIVKVEEKVEFGAIVGLYGPEIISLRTAEKAYYNNLSFKRNGAIVKNDAQRRFMDVALGHGPGSQFRGLESLMDMIRKGTGRYFRLFLLQPPNLY